MRASLLALLLLAACDGGDAEGGLSEDEAERLDRADEMLEQREGRFEDREVDEVAADEGEQDEGPEDAPAED